MPTYAANLALVRDIVFERFGIGSVLIARLVFFKQNNHRPELTALGKGR
jgi:hypothetical protein